MIKVLPTTDIEIPKHNSEPFYHMTVNVADVTIYQRMVVIVFNGFPILIHSINTTEKPLETPGPTTHVSLTKNALMLHHSILPWTVKVTVNAMIETRELSIPAIK